MQIQNIRIVLGIFIMENSLGTKLQKDFFLPMRHRMPHTCTNKHFRTQFKIPHMLHVALFSQSYC